MLSIEIRVNGHPVGMIEGHRGDMVSDRAETVKDPTIVAFQYPYRATFLPLKIDGPPITYQGAVDHNFYDGMEKLASLILADIAKQKKGKKDG